ncbi:class I SAM-dependent methyltransferase [Bacillus benzoevorans]|uniref:Class I SAM-dependent methyltransferase n=1 Tax=Bacillus benzoevorans TaxID=1456 RepID=A0A7X0LUQ6_9BACI|nr:class I SAM-dependent methyltransferase [Bacillus benzoevorans]MBB6445211.1 hypothetical protein [Bacillus benzoevorans]
MVWKYYKPEFDLDKFNPKIRGMSAWLGHRNFAYDLVRFMKPKTIVELGSQFGVSFFSFCQAVKDEGLSTNCFAVDTWKGDPHAGYYGEEVYTLVKHINDIYFPNVANLIRGTFDEAVKLFPDQCIDILHIDGFHTFDAVSHDYQTWLPKVAENGAILFHDIEVKNRGFGVYQLWNTLKGLYPSFQFEHSFGLGILFPKGYNEGFKEIFNKVTEMKNIYETK